MRMNYIVEITGFIHNEIFRAVPICKITAIEQAFGKKLQRIFEGDILGLSVRGVYESNSRSNGLGFK